MKNVPFTNDLNICDTSVIFGIRPEGRVVDTTEKGRTKCGILYIKSGEVRFAPLGEKTRAVTANEIVFIPKNKKYRLKYTAESTSFTTTWAHLMPPRLSFLWVAVLTLQRKPWITCLLKRRRLVSLRFVCTVLLLLTTL